MFYLLFILLSIILSSLSLTCFHPSLYCHDTYPLLSNDFTYGLHVDSLDDCKYQCSVLPCSSISYQDLNGLNCFIYNNRRSVAGRTCDRTKGKQEVYYYANTCNYNNITTPLPDSTTLLSCTPTVIKSGQPTVCTLKPQFNYQPMPEYYQSGWPYKPTAVNDVNGIFSDFTWSNNMLTFMYTPPSVPSSSQLSNAAQGIYWPPVVIQGGIPGVFFDLYLAPITANRTWHFPNSNFRKIFNINNISLPIDPRAPITSLSNFPILCQFDESTPYAESHPLGYDLRFILNGDMNIDLNHEIESWNDNAISNVWVNIPTIYLTNIGNNAALIEQFTIYAYFGNPSSAGLRLESAMNVWSTEYQLVMHMQKSWKDSSKHASVTLPYEVNIDNNVISYQNPGVGVSTPTTNTHFGKTSGSGMKLNGNSYVSFGAPTTPYDILDLSSKDFTVETWVRENRLNFEDALFSQGNQVDGRGIGWGFAGDHTNIYAKVFGYPASLASSNSYLETDTFRWHHRGIVFSNNTVQHFLNGKSLGPPVQLGKFDTWPEYGSIKIGYSLAGGASQISLDEFRISMGTLRSLTYFALQYNMMMNGGLITVGDLETVPAVSGCFSNCGECQKVSGVPTCIVCSDGYVFSASMNSCVQTCPPGYSQLAICCAPYTPILSCDSNVVAASKTLNCYYSARRPGFTANLYYGRDFTLNANGAGSIFVNISFGVTFGFTFTAFNNVTGFFTITDNVIGVLDGGVATSFGISIYGQFDSTSNLFCDFNLLPVSANSPPCYFQPMRNSLPIYTISSLISFSSLPHYKKNPNIVVKNFAPLNLVSNYFTFNLKSGAIVGEFSLFLGNGDIPYQFNIVPSNYLEIDNADYIFAGSSYNFTVLPRKSVVINGVSVTRSVYSHTSILSLGDGLYSPDPMAGTFSILPTYADPTYSGPYVNDLGWSTRFDVVYTSSVFANGFITLFALNGTVTKRLGVSLIPDSTSTVICPPISPLGYPLSCSVFPKLNGQSIYTQFNLLSMSESNGAGYFGALSPRFSNVFNVTFYPNENSAGPYLIKSVPGTLVVTVIAPRVPDSSSKFYCNATSLILNLGPQVSSCTFVAMVNNTPVMAYSSLISLSSITVNGAGESFDSTAELSTFNTTLDYAFTFSFTPSFLISGISRIFVGGTSLNFSVSVFTKVDQTSVLTCDANSALVNTEVTCQIIPKLNSLQVFSLASNFSSYFAYSVSANYNFGSSRFSSLTPSYGNLFTFTYSVLSSTGIINLYPSLGGSPFTIYQYNFPDSTSTLDCGLQSLLLLNSTIVCTVNAKVNSVSIFTFVSSFKWFITSSVRQAPGFSVSPMSSNFASSFTVNLTAVFTGPFTVSNGVNSVNLNVYTIPDSTTTMTSCARLT